MFICPECQKKSLQITLSFEVPPDSRSDEIAIQRVECEACGFTALTIYEESRRGASELVDHFGYFIAPDDLATLTAEMQSCSTPQNARCNCAAHQKLGRQNPSGQWDGLAHIALNQSFPLAF